VSTITPEADATDLDERSFLAFYEDALPRVYGYLLHRCGGSVAVAEDLTQETFLAAVSELKKGHRVERPIPWVYGIARHKLLDHYRRRRRDEPTVPPPELDSDDERRRAVSALAAVPPSQRAALVLCYMDGFSAGEIAAALGKSPAAVHSLLERGRAAFRRAYLEGST